MTVPKIPFKSKNRICCLDGHSNTSNSLKCKKKNSGQHKTIVKNPTKPKKRNYFGEILGINKLPKNKGMSILSS